MFISGLATRNQFITIFTTPPDIIVTMVSFSLPDACNIAFSISTMHTKKLAAPMMRRRPGPAALLLGYSTCIIG